MTATGGNGPAFVTRAEGPAVEREIAFDMVKRAAPFAPVVILACALGWGFAGGASAAYAIALVLVNFVVAAALLSWSARISLGLMMGAALFGYILRLGAITAAVLLVKDQSWVSLWPLGITLILSHLGLLFWETRFVSASLAFPGLKPRKD